MTNEARLDMIHLRIPQEFAKLLQYIRYDNPEDFSSISCWNYETLEITLQSWGFKYIYMNFRASYFWC